MTVTLSVRELDNLGILKRFCELWGLTPDKTNRIFVGGWLVHAMITYAFFGAELIPDSLGYRDYFLSRGMDEKTFKLDQPDIDALGLQITTKGRANES